MLQAKRWEAMELTQKTIDAFVKLINETFVASDIPPLTPEQSEALKGMLEAIIGEKLDEQSQPGEATDAASGK
jgi:hypothetical protein